ncbi:FAD-dependent oxidoreductase [Orrella sp. JC864]|uniref:FAD-dependent oxidoreductase n=1 Tax=Orrella sp. JC864 TaxID=3120298 RepID=UPI00300ABDAD
MAEFDCDVAVIGGGVTGVAAGIAAARQGARTLLLEPRPFVGGNATTGLCLHNYVTRYGRQVVFGLAQEIVDELIAMGGAVGHVPYEGFTSAVTPVDGNYFRIKTTEMLARAGVQVLYGATVVDVQTRGRGIESLRFAAKGGLHALRARNVIDATGDGDIAAMAGVPFRKGDGPRERMQPISMILHFHNVDTRRIAAELGEIAPAMASRPEGGEPIPVYFNGSFSKWNDAIMAEGLFPNRDRHVFFNTVWPDQINVNTSAVLDLDGTDPVQLSRATVELTAQCARIGDFLKRHVPGFEHSYCIPAAIPGVRESRNINGRYQLSDEDVLEGRKFEDTIGQVCFPVDIHAPESSQAIFHQIGGDGAFDIPYRTMLPADYDNLVVAGRCVSATHVAHGATRNMAPCLVMGEAAGTAAAMASAAGGQAGTLAVQALQDELLKNRVYLGEAFAHRTETHV